MRQIETGCGSHPRRSRRFRLPRGSPTLRSQEETQENEPGRDQQEEGAPGQHLRPTTSQRDHPEACQHDTDGPADHQPSQSLGDTGPAIGRRRHQEANIGTTEKSTQDASEEDEKSSQDPEPYFPSAAQRTSSLGARIWRRHGAIRGDRCMIPPGISGERQFFHARVGLLDVELRGPGFRQVISCRHHE